MKYMGIDHGDKRIGIAVSDASGRIAFPKRVVPNRGASAFIEIKKLVEQEQVSRVIVGLPLVPGKPETEQAQKVRAFAEKLHQEIMLTVEFENELLTTHMAEQAGIKKEHTDEAAAAIILQSYLDKINKDLG